MTGADGARRTTLGAAFDLLAVYGDDPTGGFCFERDGLGVAASGLGEGTRIEAASLEELAIAAREILGQQGTQSGGPIAVGALPFDGRDPALVVPARSVRRDDEGATWLLEVGDGGTAPFRPERVTGSLPHEAFRPRQLVSLPDERGYADAVEEVVTRIERGVLDKAVLARTVIVEAGRRLDARRLLHRLRAVEPHCYAFAAPAPSGAIVGASPELLVGRRGRRVRSTPLAGTAPRSGDPDEDRANADALVASSKDRREHALVVDAVAEVLGACCGELTFDAEPVLEPTANVWHLATRFEGRLRDEGTTALDLVAALHPTPAVGGTPRAAALATIGELEPFRRGAYAGPVGWVDAAGDGEWAIALRCAELDGERATLYAGAGIVAGSDPAAELEETDRKFRAFLDSLRWG